MHKYRQPYRNGETIIYFLFFIFNISYFMASNKIQKNPSPSPCHKVQLNRRLDLFKYRSI